MSFNSSESVFVVLGGDLPGVFEGENMLVVWFQQWVER
jgi:hypothetical protein